MQRRRQKQGARNVPQVLTRADHKVRMDQRFYADDIEAGMRAANRLGGDELAIGHARAAVIKRLNTAKTLLDAVPASAPTTPVTFSRACNGCGRTTRRKKPAS